MHIYHSFVFSSNPADQTFRLYVYPTPPKIEFNDFTDKSYTITLPEKDTACEFNIASSYGVYHIVPKRDPYKTMCTIYYNNICVTNTLTKEDNPTTELIQVHIYPDEELDKSLIETIFTPLMFPKEDYQDNACRFIQYLTRISQEHIQAIIKYYTILNFKTVAYDVTRYANIIAESKKECIRDELVKKETGKIVALLYSKTNEELDYLSFDTTCFSWYTLLNGMNIAVDILLDHQVLNNNFKKIIFNKPIPYDDISFFFELLRKIKNGELNSNANITDKEIHCTIWPNELTRNCQRTLLQLTYNNISGHFQPLRFHVSDPDTAYKNIKKTALLCYKNIIIRYFIWYIILSNIPYLWMNYLQVDKSPSFLYWTEVVVSLLLLSRKNKNPREDDELGLNILSKNIVNESDYVPIILLMTHLTHLIYLNVVFKTPLKKILTEIMGMSTLLFCYETLINRKFLLNERAVYTIFTDKEMFKKLPETSVIPSLL